VVATPNSPGHLVCMARRDRTIRGAEGSAGSLIADPREKRKKGGRRRSQQRWARNHVSYGTRHVGRTAWTGGKTMKDRGGEGASRRRPGPFASAMICGKKRGEGMKIVSPHLRLLSDLIEPGRLKLRIPLETFAIVGGPLPLGEKKGEGKNRVPSFANDPSGWPEPSPHKGKKREKNGPPRTSCELRPMRSKKKRGKRKGNHPPGATRHPLYLRSPPCTWENTQKKAKNGRPRPSWATT